MNRRRILIGCGTIFVLLIICGAITTLFAPDGEEIVSRTEEEAVSENVSETEAEVASDEPSDTVQEPTAEPTATELPEETSTPEPTATAEPTATLEPTPEPIVFTGTGDDVLDFEKPNEGAVLVRVEGSATGNFVVTAVTDDGTPAELLVNVIGGYSGTRLLDANGLFESVRFEVMSNGEWTIEVLPLDAAPIATVPSTLEGNGDAVYRIDGEVDTANITGNQSGSGLLAINTYTPDALFPLDLPVNTIDSYEGTVALNGADYIAIQSNQQWTIELNE